MFKTFPLESISRILSLDGSSFRLLRLPRLPKPRQLQPLLRTGIRREAIGPAPSRQRRRTGGDRSSGHRSGGSSRLLPTGIITRRGMLRLPPTGADSSLSGGRLPLM
jgi:hypothetical protein